MTDIPITLPNGTKITVPVDTAMVISTEPMSMEEMIELLEAHHSKRLAIVANKKNRTKEQK